MKPSPKAKIISDGSGVLHSPTGQGDQAFDNVVKSLKDRDQDIGRPTGTYGSSYVSDRH